MKYESLQSMSHNELFDQFDDNISFKFTRGNQHHRHVTDVEILVRDQSKRILKSEFEEADLRKHGKFDAKTQGSISRPPLKVIFSKQNSIVGDSRVNSVLNSSVDCLKKPESKEPSKNGNGNSIGHFSFRISHGKGLTSSRGRQANNNKLMHTNIQLNRKYFSKAVVDLNSSKVNRNVQKMY